MRNRSELVKMPIKTVNVPVASSSMNKELSKVMIA